MNETLLYICVAGAVALVVFFISKLTMGDKDGRIRSRLSNTAEAQAVDKNGGARKSVAPMLQRLGQAAAQPFMPKTREKQSSVRKQLGFAGIYSASAIKVMTGAKVLLLGGGLLVGYLLGLWLEMTLLFVSLGGLVGYMLPAMWLKSRIKRNQMALTQGLPDALDLMVVCVEAGLTMDAAMQRVGQELLIAHPAISREFGIAHMETRVGLARAESLKNLAQRTGNAALASLSSMLIQAERFGTSIAQALRIHAETLRINRQQIAEEQAAKASVKMSFPLVLFIFPATFIVLAGPTVVGLMNSPIMN